jgi:hypothetical protein
LSVRTDDAFDREATAILEKLWLAVTGGVLADGWASTWLLELYLQMLTGGILAMLGRESVVYLRMKTALWLAWLDVPCGLIDSKAAVI